MMQDGSMVDSSASTKKALARAQRVLQVAATKRNAVALRDVRETLDECLRTEASSAMKALGYRLVGKAPACMTVDTWALVLDACVSELAGSQNAPVLLLCIPVLEQVPPPLLLGLFVSTEKEPMNKLRAVLTHESADVRCCAVSTLSRVALGVASGLSNGALAAFPFESHEARVCCQQDAWSMVVDVWKLVFQTLLLGDPSQRDAVGAALAAMRTLFARTVAMAPFFPLARVHPRTQGAMNDLASAIFKEAFPQARALLAVGRALPMRHQATAALWIAMLLFMMMERTGARCPSVSVPYLDLDPEVDAADTDPDEYERASTERVRIDELVREQLRTWLLPLLSSKASLSQASSICRAVFLLLSHPLQRLARIQHSTVLVSHLVAQCAFVKSGALKLEFARMLVRAFPWLSSAGCAAWFTRAVDAIFLIDVKAERTDLLESLMASTLDRVHRHRDFELFESLCAVELLSPRHLSASKLAHSTIVAEVFHAIARAVTSCDESAPMETKQSLQLTQLIALKVFKGALTPKLPAASEDRVEAANRRGMLRCYMGLLTGHFLQSAVWSTGPFLESLEFFRKDVLKIWRQIPSLRARLQLLSIGMHLAAVYQLVPAQVMVDAVKYEVVATFALASGSDGDGAPLSMGTATATATVAAAFDDGRLGSGSTGCEAVADLVMDAPQPRWVGADVLLAVAECLRHMITLHPPSTAQLSEIYQELQRYVATNCPATQLCHHILEQQRLVEGRDAPPGFFYSQELMNPYAAFLPLRQLELSSLPSFESERHKEPTLVTGSADPLAIHMSYYQPSEAALDVVVLEVTCCNLTSLALSDFDLRVCPVSNAAKCIDASNDLRVRLLPAGGAVSSTLPPFGVLKAEKRFQVCKFTQAAFRAQVAFSGAEASSSSEQQDQEQTAESLPPRLAMSDAFVVHFDALLSAPRDADAAASFFQTQWQSAHSSIQLPVQSRPRDGAAGASTANALSICQRVLQRTSPRVAVVAELLVDLPFYCHVALMAKTRWGDYITASLTLLLANESAPAPETGTTKPPAPKWSGALELRSTAINTRELDKSPLDVVRIFTGSVLERAVSHDAPVAWEPSRTPPIAVAGPADPFVRSKPDSTSVFAADSPPVETRLPHDVSSDSSDYYWSNPSKAQQKPAALSMGVSASASADPWL